MRKTSVKRFVDRVVVGDKKTRPMVTLVFEDENAGMFTYQVRPWNGSIEVRYGAESLCIEDVAVGPLLAAIREVAKALPQ